MSYAAFYIPHTIFDLVTSFNFKPLTSFGDFKDAWFARFWIWFGPRSRQVVGGTVTPLLENNLHGVVLDIGPGAGGWLDLYAQAMNPGVSKIYGVEPNKGLHAQLRANAVKAGLGDVYEIIGSGAEELGSKGGVQKGSVDTIVTVQCLCSIPEPERVIKGLYPLLKPGGKWLVFEHVRTKYRGEFVWYWEREFFVLEIGVVECKADFLFCSDLINVVWPHFFNGCDIARPTDEWLLRAGEWEEVKLGPAKGEGPYDTVPHVVGTLRKAT